MSCKEIRYICALEPEFPEKLRNIPSAPQGIYVRGRLPDPEKKTVSIIGSRNNTEYGRGVAEYFAKTLSGYGVQIVSGMARGIDGISQMAAVKNGGMSFGILGCGIDEVYPPENAGLYKDILLRGGLISEYPPGTAPRGVLFPQRNRIISALSDILLVIEAKAQSGTAITVRFALEQGRDIFAVPGRVTDPLSRGCNRLIADGAGIATCPEDILEALGLIEPEKTDGKIVNLGKFGHLSGKQLKIMRCLDYSPTSVNEIVEKCALSLSEVLTALLKLELKGCVEKAGAGCYILKMNV
ncbi:MAG: DNA-processing protein DprA [Lachnospiraceae bacterium]|nr:DNA-processing protein DprA [Lachnospiraceae bacterium]